MIKTDKFSLTNLDYFKILITTYLKKRWWMISLMLLFGLFFIFKQNKDSFEYFLLFFAFFYPIILLIQYWRYANSKENKLFLIERFFEISEDSITGILTDGSKSIVKLDNIIKVTTLKKYYLLYISKSQFIYIPKNSFMNQQDQEWFTNEIIKKLKK
jgi:hypothetical protein